MELLDGIYSRRSVRHYTAETVARETLLEIVKAGTWAPSGLNNQPWRFVLVRESAVRKQMAELTRYARIIREAPALVAVFIDRQAMYNELKDYQGIGACLQNILLAAHALGLGAVWLGEILNSAQAVRELLELPEHLELMAVVAVGHPARRDQSSERHPIDKVLLKEI